MNTLNLENIHSVEKYKPNSRNQKVGKLHSNTVEKN